MLHLELDGRGARYAQLARALREAICSGRLRAGSRLPPTRDLALELGVSRNTVLAAYETICAEQLAEPRAGSGTYVSDRAPGADPLPVPMPVAPQSSYARRLRQLPPLVRRSSHRPRHDLQYGEPLLDPALVTAWKKQLAAAADRARLHYPPAHGLRELREAIAEHVARRRGVACDAEDVVVVHGTQQAVSLLARLLLDEGDLAAIEDPHYPLIARALTAHGARVLAVPTDAEGLRCAGLPHAPAVVPRVVFVTPSHQFPGGSEMSPGRRRELLRYADEQGCWIIEDDYDGEFRYSPKATPTLRSLDERGRVIYVGTFSKAVFPALRMGYVIAPRGLRDDLVETKRLHDMGCGGIEQLAMARFIADGGLDRHLRKAAAELRRRRRALLAGLARHAPGLEVAQSTGGMHVVAWLPGWTVESVDALIARAAARGLGLHPIHTHYVHAPPAPGLLLGFAGLSVPQLQDATARLGACLGEAARPGAPLSGCR